MNTRIRAMVIDDYPAVLDLWQRSEGIGLNESDTREAVDAYLRRNPGMSAVSESDADVIVGAVLCGHDGRRGYLHHLAVEPAFRRHGLGRQLLAWSFERFQEAGVPRCNILVFQDNESGADFWSHNGWNARTDLRVFQKVIGCGEQGGC